MPQCGSIPPDRSIEDCLEEVILSLNEHGFLHLSA